MAVSSETSGRRRVVVTGLGAATGAGWGVAALRESTRAGRTAIGPFDRIDHARQRTHVAGQVPPEPASAAAAPVGWARLSHADRFALYSALEAVAQAGLGPAPIGARAGVFFGSTTGGLYETELYFERLVRAPGSRPDRRLLASHTHAAPAETVARYLGIEGPVETVSSACASGGLALEQTLRAVRSGEVDLALAGGSDSLTLTTYSGFNALRAVDQQPCRPFRADRGGLSLGEGGAVLVVEDLAHALARGQRPLAEILGAGSSCDAGHMTAPNAEGLGAALAIERALEDAGLAPGAIDLVNTHGTGTPLNDAAEYAALRRVFGERLDAIPMEATKAILGHLLGTAGAIEAISTIVGLIEREVRPTPGGGDVDPGLPISLILDGVRPAPSLRAALSVSFGFGGANAAIVLARWEDS